MDILIKALQLILSLSLLVVLHEFGHYIPAKLFKTRVEKFYLFFNYKFSLIKKKIGETEWGIGWIPLGGYVKIAGMIDESMDTEQMNSPAQPWEFRSKPAWQRLIIMTGGVIVNLVLGVVIYIGIVATWGDEQMNPNDVNQGLSVAPIMEKYGFKTGDVVLSADGKVLEDALDVNKEIMLRSATTFQVKHIDGKVETLKITEDTDMELFKAGVMLPFNYRVKSNVVDSVVPKGKGNAAGKLQKGDVLLAINGQEITYFDEVTNALWKSREKEANFAIQRNGEIITEKIKVSKEGTIGFYPKRGELGVDTTKLQHHSYGFGASIVRGTNYGMQTLGDYIGQLKYIFTKKGASSVGGFLSIGNMFPAQWDWLAFWEKTALISIILAFMNILPIPALDGGHVMFLLYEMITGKEAPQKVLEYAQYAGIIILLSLMLYANGMDIVKSIIN